MTSFLKSYFGLRNTLALDEAAHKLASLTQEQRDRRLQKVICEDYKKQDALAPLTQEQRDRVEKIRLETPLDFWGALARVMEG